MEIRAPKSIFSGAKRVKKAKYKGETFTGKFRQAKRLSVLCFMKGLTMEREIQNQIIEATCSKSLQEAIRQIKFEVADFDLLLLAYRHAPDYDTRLSLLSLVENTTKDKTTKERAIKWMAFEKEKLCKFVEPEENCVFEVKIKEAPDSWEERYLARTCSGALKKFDYFCKYYYEVIRMDANSRFEIIKRRCVDETKFEDFNEDWRAEATYNRNSILINVLYEDLEIELLNGVTKCDSVIQNCHACKNPCLTNKIPRLPQFLKNLDIVCYNNYFGKKQYAVVFVFKDNDEIDDCAYCIPLDKERICNKVIRSRKAFYEKLFELHEHIEYPRIDIIQAADLPKDALRAYQTLFRLNERYGSDYK